MHCKIKGSGSFYYRVKQMIIEIPFNKFFITGFDKGRLRSSVLRDPRGLTQRSSRSQHLLSRKELKEHRPAERKGVADILSGY